MAWHVCCYDAVDAGGRVTAIEKVQYDDAGRILPITMTKEGVGPVDLKDRKQP